MKQISIEVINQSAARNSDALISLARLKHADNYTYLRSVSVYALMIAIERQLGLEGGYRTASAGTGRIRWCDRAPRKYSVRNKYGAKRIPARVVSKHTSQYTMR